MSLSSSARTAMLRNTEKSVSKYRILAELGSGGMARVYLAVAVGPVGFTKLLVLKVLRDELAEDPSFVAMFYDEARLAAQLNHPNVVQTYEVDLNEGRPYLVMEYLQGQSLDRLRRRIQGVPERVRVCLRAIIDSLGGLDYAHDMKDYAGKAQGLVHRDVTPANIFVTYDGQAKVLDFGIAKVAARVSQTNTGDLKGTLRYMSPEHISGKVDRRTDIFSVGLVLWELIAGRRVWEGFEEHAVLGHITAGTYPTIAVGCSAMPPELARICEKALACDPDARYSKAAEFAEDLELYLATSGAAVTSRQVAKLMQELFEKERTELITALEEVMTMPEGAIRSVVTGSSSSGSGANASTFSPASQGLTVSEPTGPTATRHLSQVRETSHGSRGARRSSVALLGAAIIATSVLAAGTYWRRSTNHGEPLPAPAPSAPPSASTAPPASAAAPLEDAPALVAISLVGTPKNAKITIDDELVTARPPEAKMRRDDQAHRIRIEAAGYATKTLSVKFDNDKSIDGSLNEAPRSTASAKQAVPTPSSAPVSTIDRSIPW